jgi:flagellar hook-length control protein FliK
MRWEIEEDAGRREQGSEDAPSNWQTRLRLTLPNLGGIDAQIRLQGNQISLVLAAGNTETQDLLRSSTAALRSQLDDAGLALASVGVGTAKDEAANGQTAV